MTATVRPLRGRPPAQPFEEALERLDEFIADHGRLPTRSGRSADGFPVGLWLSRLVTKNTNGHLAQEDYEALRSRGVTFPHDDGHTVHLSLAEQAAHAKSHSSWPTRLAQVDEFIAEHGHARIPLTYVTGDGTSLRGFLERVRAAYHRGQLPDDKIDALNARGFQWDPPPGRKDYPDVFADWIRCLDRYARETGGRANPPRRWQCWHAECAHRDLGEFVYRARGKYWAGTLTADQVAALEQRGVNWDPLDLRKGGGVGPARPARPD